MNRKTPTAIGRQLRQESGFGCCECGIPIIQYHHIVEWAEDQHFRPEDMMVLCPTHHDKATKGAMSVAEQRKLKTSPFNIRRGLVKGDLEVKQDYCAANFGSITIVGEGPFLRIDGEDVLSFRMEEGVLQLSLRLYSEKDELLLEIEKNEWVSGDPLPWDIEADWQTLTLREKARKISLNLNLKAIPMEITGRLWRSGISVILSSEGIRVGNRGPEFKHLAFVGTVFEIGTKDSKFGPPAGQEAVIVSWPNPRERLWRARDAWNKMRSRRAD